MMYTLFTKKTTQTAADAEAFVCNSQQKQFTFTQFAFTKVLGVLALAVPLIHANGQVLEPGKFDPATTKAHQEDRSAEPNKAATDLSAADPAAAQGQAVKTAGRIVIPSSSLPRSEDTGLRAHTHHMVFIPQGGSNAANANAATGDNLAPAAAPQPNYTFAENPGSLGCVYQVGPTYAGCTPAGGFGKHPSGGSGTIAIVDAYHNPNAAADLAYFSSYWGLPAADFTQIYCQPYPGTCSTSNPKPPTNTGWGLEEALDIEWAHAMAPNAKILLIEAPSNSYNDLTWAEAWAGYFVDVYGGGQVSNSWGGGEFTGETNYDGYFNNYFGNFFPVTYIASGGDSGTVEYPSASPFVVSAGGTTVNRDSAGNFLSQTCWAGTGRGPSTVEARPSYQDVVASVVGSHRGTTDLSFDADPASGVWVYDALNGGWFTVGGTSVSAPSLAGVINNAGNKLATSFQENNLLYSQYPAAAMYAANFYDVSPVGYDFCTGVGTPKTLIGK